MIEQKDVTIIIPHFTSMTEKQESVFSLCIQSLKDTVSDMDIVVVNNGPHNDQCQHLHDMVINRQGQCRAVNAAIAIVNTPWVLVTNDDMVFPQGWFDKLMEGMQEGRLCMSPKLVEPRPGAPTFIVHSCGETGKDFDKQKFLEFVKNYNGVSDLGVFCHTGFNLPFLIKRELWDLIGGYDINYDPWGSNSDSDLEYKIRLAGIQPIQNDKCLVYHFSNTSGTFSPEHQDAWNKNWNYFIEKWGFERTDTGIWEANFVIPMDRLKFHPEWEGKYK